MVHAKSHIFVTIKAWYYETKEQEKRKAKIHTKSTLLRPMGNMNNNKSYSKKQPCLCNLGIILMSIMWLSKVVLCNINDPCKSRSYSDNDVLQFSRNIQFLNAEFFHCGATGESIDAYDPSLAAGGPPPLGCQRANLDPMSRRMVEEFALEEVGNLR